jgi:serine/threonine protein kinase
MYQALAKDEIYKNKNELGLIIDLISSCLDPDPNKRPTIKGLRHSPLFKLDKYEKVNAVRFSENVILYRSPQVAVINKICTPLRNICG